MWQEQNCRSAQKVSGPKISFIFAFPTGVSLFFSSEKEFEGSQIYDVDVFKQILCLVAVEKLI